MNRPIISEDIPAVYIETHKCASQSWNRVVEQENKVDRGRRYLTNVWGSPTVHPGFTFSFIRHPLTRFESFLRMKHRQRDTVTGQWLKPFQKVSPEKLLDIVFDRNDWQDWIGKWDKLDENLWKLGRHLAPYSDPVNHVTEACFVGRMETFDDDVARLRRLLGFRCQMPKLNANTNEKGECNIQFVTPALIDLIYDTYRADYEFGNYSKLPT